MSSIRTAHVYICAQGEHLGLHNLTEACPMRRFVADGDYDAESHKIELLLTPFVPFAEKAMGVL